MVKLGAQAELFHTPDQQPFATIRVNDHAETWSLKSPGFRLWLQREFHRTTGTIPSSQATQEAFNTLMGKALFDGHEHPVFMRLAEHEGAIYLDRADSEWTAIRIGPEGWEVVKEPPLKFRRARGMLPLPMPLRGGSISALARFINVWDEPTWRLLMAWVMAALRPRGPYPILVLNGEHGSAKSTLTKIVRRLLDPSKVALRRPPREDRDLMIAAANSWVIALDNVSQLPNWLSDSLCVLATGGGFGTRELYTDQEEVLFDAMRPIIINGIGEIVPYPDFLDRSLAASLAEIPDELRRDEEEFWSEFDDAAPRILGALLDAVAAGLSVFPEVRLDRKPRMADFARWATACGPGLAWPDGSFMRVYDEHRRDSATDVLEASAVGTALCTFIGSRSAPWEGTASDLLAALDPLAPDVTKKRTRWPRSPRGLRSALERLAPNLRRSGIGVEFGSREPGTGRRLISIRSRAPERQAENRHDRHDPHSPPNGCDTQGPGGNGRPTVDPDEQGTVTDTITATAKGEGCEITGAAPVRDRCDARDGSPYTDCGVTGDVRDSDYPGDIEEGSL